MKIELDRKQRSVFEQEIGDYDDFVPIRIPSKFMYNFMLNVMFTLFPFCCLIIRNYICI